MDINRISRLGGAFDRGGGDHRAMAQAINETKVRELKVNKSRMKKVRSPLE